MKILKKIALALLIVFIAMQFYRPEKNIAEDGHDLVFIEETSPEPAVKTLLKQACYDCHSNNTVYPWYNSVAPVSYWLADHVNDGKKHLNFSEWASYSAKKKDHKLEEVIEMVEELEMPLNEYTWTHEEARLTEEQRQDIIAWAKKARELYEVSQEPK